jgi:hypothetical protein
MSARPVHKDKTADQAIGNVSANAFHAVDLRTKARRREVADAERNERLRRLREGSDGGDAA